MSNSNGLCRCGEVIQIIVLNRGQCMHCFHQSCVELEGLWWVAQDMAEQERPEGFDGYTLR